MLGKFKLLCSGIDLVDKLCVWDRAFRALVGHEVPMALRSRFANAWPDIGCALRNNVGDDLALIAGLRVLLPPYTGGPVQLFRGDSAWNRRRRTYGPSWTTNIEVAGQFADDTPWRTCEGGSVVITTIAEPEPIISMPRANDGGLATKKNTLLTAAASNELM